MFLMLWVNDLWTLKDIPKWLKHAGPEDDYLGFSDIIFPWFYLLWECLYHFPLKIV